MDKIYFVGCEVLTTVVVKSCIFWDIMLCIPLNETSPKAGSPAFRLVSCVAYSSTLKMEATCSSETSVDFQQTTQCYIPEDRALHDLLPS
jgi:hypothetical protein